MRRLLVLTLACLAVVAGCLDGGEEVSPEGLEPAEASPEAEDNGSAGASQTQSGSAEDSQGSQGEANRSARGANGTKAGGDRDEANDTARAPVVEPTSTSRPDPEVTVAVVDTGANLYHRAFRAGGPAGHPPPNATPVELSLNAGGYRSAVEADWSKLASLESGELYRFPGTRFVGAISFLDPWGCATPAEQVCQNELSWPRILDDPENGTPHGTWTASRVVGPGIGLATEQDVRLVLVQVQLNGTSIARGFQWVEDQDWIDAVSVSLFARNGLADSDFLDTLHRISHDKPVFVSTGNGVGNVGLAPKPDWAQDGLPDTIAVGGVDNDRLTHWSDQDPYVAADACGTPLASADATNGTAGVLGGTSFSAPYVAGAGAELILKARQLLGDERVGPRTNDSLTAPTSAWSTGHAGDAHVVLAEGEPGAVASGPLTDGAFTLRELKDVLYHTAQPTPTVHPHDGIRCRTTHAPAEPVPDQARFTYVGYGEVTPSSLDVATSILHGHAQTPDRPAADTQYERAHTLRALTTQRQAPSP